MYNTQNKHHLFGSHASKRLKHGGNITLPSFLLIALSACGGGGGGSTGGDDNGGNSGGGVSSPMMA